MSYAPPEENTLGVIIGSKSRRREADATRRVIRAATPRRASLGTGFIGIGAAVVSGLVAIYGFVWFVSYLSEYPHPLYPSLAWALLITTLLATFIYSRVIGDQLPNWAFALYGLGLAGTVALDLYGIWPLHNVGHFATASIAAGVSLVLVITLRRSWDVVISAALLGAALVAAMFFDNRGGIDVLAPQITTLALATIPAMVGVFTVAGFRRLVQVELDRVLVQSTVSAPRF
ncbi:MAG: hypothetical protein EPN91_03295, partial [Salinibacterium sp.]